MNCGFLERKQENALSTIKSAIKNLQREHVVGCGVVHYSFTVAVLVCSPLQQSMLRTAPTAPNTHSTASHFSWIGTALFGGFLWMTIMSLRTYAEDPCAQAAGAQPFERATPAPTPPVFAFAYDDDSPNRLRGASSNRSSQQDTVTCQGVVVSCTIMALIAEWVFACFTILLMHSQFVQLRESHEDTLHSKDHHDHDDHDRQHVQKHTHGSSHGSSHDLDPSHARTHGLFNSPCGILLMVMLYLFLGGLCLVDTVSLTYTVTQVHPDVHNACCVRWVWCVWVRVGVVVVVVTTTTCILVVRCL